MNQMVNMIVVLEKELELERQGFRRTRRFIGDASQLIDDRWYRADGIRVAEIGQSMDGVSRLAAIKSRWEARRSILDRLFHLPRTRRDTACNEC